MPRLAPRCSATGSSRSTASSDRPEHVVGSVVNGGPGIVRVCVAKLTCKEGAQGADCREREAGCRTKARPGKACPGNRPKKGDRHQSCHRVCQRSGDSADILSQSVWPEGGRQTQVPSARGRGNRSLFCRGPRPMMGGWSAWGMPFSSSRTLCKRRGQTRTGRPAPPRGKALA